MQDEACHSSADAIFEALCHVHATLERHGIWHCLVFGTLLGAIRDGDVIAWDHDLDLLVRPVDVPRILALNEQTAEEGLWFWTGRTAAAALAANPGGVALFDTAHLGIMRDGACCGELYAPTLFADGVLRFWDREQEVVHWPRSSFPAFAVEELGTAEVRGVPFPVPRHAEALLEWHYGPDWRTPYRAVRDGGDPRDGSTEHGDVATPRLAGQIAWCERQGWDRTRYRGQPAWPRPLRGAGPQGDSPRAAATSGSEWWHTVAEVEAHY
jgi:hypothetical protein